MSFASLSKKFTALFRQNKKKQLTVSSPTGSAFTRTSLSVDQLKTLFKQAKTSEEKQLLAFEHVLASVRSSGEKIVLSGQAGGMNAYELSLMILMEFYTKEAESLIKQTAAQMGLYKDALEAVGAYAPKNPRATGEPAQVLKFPQAPGSKQNN